MESTIARRESFCSANEGTAATKNHAAASGASLNEYAMKERMSRIYNSSGTTDQVTDERVPSVPIRDGPCGFMLVE